MPNPHPKPERRQKKRLASNSTLAAPSKPMRSFSEKRRRVYDEQYLPQRARFLERRPSCEARVAGICTRIAEDVHHMIQRSLKPGVENLLDEEHWLPVCRPCHDFIGDDSVRARELGLELDPRDLGGEAVDDRP